MDEQTLLARIEALEQKLEAGHGYRGTHWQAEHVKVKKALQQELGLDNYDMSHTIGLGLDGIIRGTFGVRFINRMSAEQEDEARHLRDDIIDVIRRYRHRKEVPANGT